MEEQIPLEEQIQNLETTRKIDRLKAKIQKLEEEINALKQQPQLQKSEEKTTEEQKEELELKLKLSRKKSECDKLILKLKDYKFYLQEVKGIAREAQKLKTAIATLRAWKAEKQTQQEGKSKEIEALYGEGSTVIKKKVSALDEKTKQYILELNNLVKTAMKFKNCIAELSSNASKLGIDKMIKDFLEEKDIDIPEINKAILLFKNHFGGDKFYRYSKHLIRAMNEVKKDAAVAVADSKSTEQEDRLEASEESEKLVVDNIDIEENEVFVNEPAEKSKRRTLQRFVGKGIAKVKRTFGSKRGSNKGTQVSDMNMSDFTLPGNGNGKKSKKKTGKKNTTQPGSRKKALLPFSL